MPRSTIRFRPDGDGYWYEIRDARRQLLASAWRAGGKRYAQDEARAVRANLDRKAAA